VNCWTHDASTAVAACSFCGRGLCRACSQERPPYIVCGDRCAEGVLSVHSAAMLTHRKHVAGVTATFKFLFMISGFFFLCAVGVLIRVAMAVSSGDAWRIERDVPIAILLSGFATVAVVAGFIYRRTLRDRDQQQGEQASRGGRLTSA